MKRRESDREQKQHPDELFAEADFVWKVTTTGYRWEEVEFVRTDHSKTTVEVATLLTDAICVGETREVRRYLPLKVAGLFREFAALPSNNREPMREFANHYGALGISEQAIFPWGIVEDPIPSETRKKPSLIKVWDDKTGRVRGALGFGERIGTWSEAICNIKRAVRLHALILAEDVKKLRQLIFRRSDGWVYEEIDDLKYAVGIASRDFPLPADDVRMPARLCLQKWINNSLFEQTAPQLLWDRDQTQHVFRFMPKNLLGALWLQFARVVAGDVTYRPCKVCGKILTISTEQDGFRVDREFCGAACRQRDHRRKVREAKSLRTKGKSVREIAKHFDTSVETIKGWLNKER